MENYSLSIISRFYCEALKWTKFRSVVRREDSEGRARPELLLSKVKKSKIIKRFIQKQELGIKIRTKFKFCFRHFNPVLSIIFLQLSRL